MINADCATREEAIDLLVDLHYRLGNIKNRERFRRAVIERESGLSTFVGGGIALPHGRDASVTKPCIAAITLKDGIPWGENTVDTVIMLASPDEESHIKSLSALAGILCDMLQP